MIRNVKKHIKYYLGFVANTILDTKYSRNSLVNKITILLIVIGIILTSKWYFYTKTPYVIFGFAICFLLFVLSVFQSFNKFQNISKSFLLLAINIFIFLISIVYYHVYPVHLLFICISFLYVCTFYSRKMVFLYSIILVFLLVFIKDINSFLLRWNFLNSSVYTISLFSNIVTSSLLFFLFYTFIQFYNRSIENEKKIVKQHNKLLLESQNNLLEAIKFKDSFYANISHHIRTPMNAIQGLTSMLQSASNEIENKNYLLEIERSAKNINNLLNQLLEGALAFSDQMEDTNSEFDIRHLLENTNNLFLKVQRQHKVNSIIKVSDSIQTLCIGNEGKLSFVLLNLISFFSEKSNSCDLLIEVNQKDIVSENVQNIEFNITCTDVYFNLELLKYLLGEKTSIHFSNFEVQDSHFIAIGLIPQILKILKGNLSIYEKSTGESTLSFSLPLQYSSEDLVLNEYKNNTEQILKGMNILIVEDNLTNMLILKSIVENFGANTLTASNGKIAIDYLENNSHIDCVLMDLVMPEMDGLEATSYIRNKINSKIPIIIITANAIVEDINRCYEAGCQKVLHKPLEEERLLFNILNLKKK